MTKAKLLKTYGLYIYLAIVIFLNFLPLIAYPLTESLRITGSPLLPFFSYLFKFFDGALIFIGVGVSVVLLQRRGIGHVLLSFSVLVLSKLLSSTIGTFLTSSAHWTYNLLSVLLQILLYIGFYVGLTLLLYFFFLRFDKNEEPQIWGFRNMFFASNFLTMAMTLIFQIVLKIYDVVLFITEDLYGIPALISTSELLLIIFEFVFILFSAVASYFLMYGAERLTITAMSAE